MPSVDVTKLHDSAFLKRYGNLMYYSYGCAPRTCEIYVYRITITNEDGQSVDLCWNDVKSRCNEIGVKHVPEIVSMSINHLSEDDRDRQDELLKIVDDYAQGDSLLDNRHIKEGVCARIDHYGIKPKVYKHKSFNFKVLEGIIKDSGVVDSEEAQG